MADARGGVPLALAVVVAWAAVVVAAAGLISLATGLEVVPVAEAGPLALPAGVVVAGAAVLARIARATASSTLLPLECGLLALVLIPLVGAAVALLAGGPDAALGLLESAVTRPFVVVDAIAAAAAGLAALLVLRGRRAGTGRPRWPWEDAGEP